jgi:hypothetical protein
MGHEKIVKILLENNANYNAVNGEGNTLLTVGNITSGLSQFSFYFSNYYLKHVEKITEIL